MSHLLRISVRLSSNSYIVKLASFSAKNEWLQGLPDVFSKLCRLFYGHFVGSAVSVRQTVAYLEREDPFAGLAAAVKVSDAGKPADNRSVK